MSDEPLITLRDRLLDLHREARALGEHQAAYHALAGALHAGQSLREVETCDAVEALAREYGQWIEVHEPKHPVSSQSASVRGHPGIFEQLATTAAAVRARLKSEARTRK